MYETYHQKFKILFCEGNGSPTRSARIPVQIRPQIILEPTETEKAI